jgi:hypothetical protein
VSNNVVEIQEVEAKFVNRSQVVVCCPFCAKEHIHVFNGRMNDEELIRQSGCQLGYYKLEFS